MPQLRFVRAAFAASAVFFVSSLASAIVAPAPGCGTGPACAYGFECAQVSASASCAPSIPCAAGQACPTPEPCTTTIEYGCVPVHCTQDAECGAGMVCHAWTEPCAVTDCACPPNVPSCNCGPTVCNPQTVSMCTPRYDLPCQVAADCGPGFTCDMTQNCGCASSGGGATPPSSGSAGASSGSAGASAGVPAPAGGSASGGSGSADPAPSPPIDCGCQPSGQMQCVAQDISCQTAAQCPAGWSCQVENVATTAPACAPGQNCPMQTPAPQPAVSKCIPPYYGAQSGGDLEVPVANTGSGTGTGGATSTGTGTGTGAGKGTGTASAGSGPTGTPNSGTPQPASTGDGQAHESAACAMGHAPASSGALALLAMLGALFGLKRRRA